MLRFFRLNDPYRLLGVLLILLIIALPLMISPLGLTTAELKARLLGEAFTEGKKIYIQVYDSTPPLAFTLFGVMDWLFGRSVAAWQIFAFLLIFFQASYFGIMLISNKAYTDNTYVPALIFGLLAFFSFDLLSFSPELMGSTFLLFTINNLFKEIEFRVQRDETVLNIGLTLGIASLFVFTYGAFLPAVLFMMVIFARAGLRKVLLAATGFLIPHCILFILFLYRGHLTSLWQNFYMPNFYFSKHALISFKSMIVIGIIPLSYFLFSLVMLNRVARFTRYQSQLLQVMFIWIAPCVIVVMLTPEVTPHTFILFLPPVAYFVSHYLLLIRRKWIAETMMWLFILGIPLISLLAKNNKLSSVNYAALFPPASRYDLTDRKVLFLGDNISVFSKNQMAGYFLDWNLSRETFEQPNMYEHLVIIDEAFRRDPPDIIIDERNLMQPVFERIPGLKEKYWREGVYYKKVSN